MIHTVHGERNSLHTYPFTLPISNQHSTMILYRGTYSSFLFLALRHEPFFDLIE